MMSATERVCSACGAAMKPAMMKCIECGTRMPSGLVPARVSVSEDSTNGGDTLILQSTRTPLPDRPLVKPKPQLNPPAQASASRNSLASRDSGAPKTRSTNSDPAIATGSGSTAAAQTPTVAARPSPGSSSVPAEGISATKKVEPTQPKTTTASASTESSPRLITATCQCGTQLKVKQEWAGKYRKCKKCSQPVLIPEVEDSTSDLEIRQLKQCVDNAISQLPSNPSIDLKKTLSAIKLKKLKEQLRERNPLDQGEAQQRRMALLELGESRDVRVFELIAPIESEGWDHVRSGLIRALGILGDPRGLPIVLRSLLDQSNEVVHEGIKALRALNSEHAVRPLLRLGLVNPHLKLYVAEAVGQIGAVAVPTLLDVVQHRDKGMLLDAIILLGKIGHESAVMTLLTTIEHTSGPIRAYAIESLGRIGDKRATSKLVEQLSDNDEIIQLNVIVALGKIGDPRAVRSLLPFLSVVDEELRRRALDALGEIGDSRAVPPILELLPEATGTLLESAVDALVKIGDAPAIDALLPLLEQSSPEQQAKILLGIKKVKSAEAVPLLLDMLEHAKPVIRRHIVDALGEIAQANTCETLKALVTRDASFEVRAAAVKALGKIGNKDVLPVLETALKDESVVRCSAVIAMGLLGNINATPALVAMLRDSAPEVRYHSVCALGKLGAKSAVSAIQALLEDPDSMVQRGAEKALEDLGVEKQRASFSKRVAKAIERMLPDAIAGSLPGRSLVVGLGTIVGVFVLAGFFFIARSSANRSVQVDTRGFVVGLVRLGEGDEVGLARSKGEVEIWDTATSKLVKEIRVEGNASLTTLGDQPACLDLRSGRITPWKHQSSDRLADNAAINLAGGALDVQLSADGKVALVRSKQGIATWDLVARKQMANLALDPKSRVALSGDGAIAAALPPDSKRLQWFGTGDGELLEQNEFNFLDAGSPALDHSGRKCIVSKPQEVLLVSRGESEVKKLDATANATPYRFVGEGLIVGWQGDTVLRFDLASQKSDRWSVPADDFNISQLAILAGGKKVAVASSEKRSFWVLDTNSGTFSEIK